MTEKIALARGEYSDVSYYLSLLLSNANEVSSLSCYNSHAQKLTKLGLTMTPNGYNLFTVKPKEALALVPEASRELLVRSYKYSAIRPSTPRDAQFVKLDKSLASWKREATAKFEHTLTAETDAPLVTPDVLDAVMTVRLLRTARAALNRVRSKHDTVVSRAQEVASLVRSNAVIEIMNERFSFPEPPQALLSEERLAAMAAVIDDADALTDDVTPAEAALVAAALKSTELAAQDIERLVSDVISAMPSDEQGMDRFLVAIGENDDEGYWPDDQDDDPDEGEPEGVLDEVATVEFSQTNERFVAGRQ